LSKEAIDVLAKVWGREQPDDERLRRLQAARLREARKLRGFPSARAAQLRYGWSSAYGSHENGTRGIETLRREGLARRCGSRASVVGFVGMASRS